MAFTMYILVIPIVVAEHKNSSSLLGHVACITALLCTLISDYILLYQLSSLLSSMLTAPL
uniref:Uncharacterized protein n=1 Tax=Rhodnius prolixus TaxID=13249 RepID=T1IE74_RHOPR